MELLKKNWKKLIVVLTMLIVVIATFIGVEVNADYANNATNLTYQKDGNTVSVNSALDDLFAKATAPKTTSFTIGQLVKLNNDPVSTDEYYVLNETSDTVDLFAKTNLNTSATAQANADYSTTACAFSSSQYWGYNSGLNLNLEPGYSATDAIGKARYYAKSKGAIEGRLLTIQEVKNLTGISDYFDSWSSMTNTTIKDMINGVENTAQSYEEYWLGSCNSNYAERVWVVYGNYSNASTYDIDFDHFSYGVRPVITVLKSQIKDDGFKDGLLYVGGELYSGYWDNVNNEAVEYTGPYYVGNYYTSYVVRDYVLDGMYSLYENGEIKTGASHEGNFDADYSQSTGGFTTDKESCSHDCLFYVDGELLNGVMDAYRHVYDGQLKSNYYNVSSGTSFHGDSVVLGGSRVCINGVSYTGTLKYYDGDYGTIPVIDGILQYGDRTCLTPDTLIIVVEEDEKKRKVLKKKKIKDIEVGDKVLSINPLTGKLEEDTVIYADGKENKKANEYDEWVFADGTVLQTILRHRFYNIENQQFMYMEDWKIGEHGYNKDGNKVELISHKKIKETTKHCTIFTEKWNNYFANNMLSGNRDSIEIKI